MNALLVPVFATNGKSTEMVSLQAIDEAGNKDSLRGGQMAGGFFILGDRATPRVQIGEGFATCASAFEATGDMTYCAFSASNLPAVARGVRQDYPNAEIVLLADVEPSGTGLKYATQAALEIRGKIALPELAEPKRDFNDVARVKGAQAVRAAIDKSAAPATPAASSGNDAMRAAYTWDAPITFDTLTTPSIDANLLPDPVGNYVAALADSTETPIALGVMIALAVLATATRGRVRVAINEGHSEPCNLYTIAALPPGNRKSSVLSALTAPLVEWEREQAEMLGPEIAQQRSTRKSEEALLDQRRRRLHSIDDETERRREIENIARTEAGLKPVPALPSLIATDATPESLARALAEQAGVLSLISDEGGIVEVLSGLYTNGQANIDVFLKGWDGGALRVRRKDRDLDLNPLLTVGLAVQPAVLANMAGKRAFAGRGVVERFLYAVPVSTLGERTHDRTAPRASLASDYAAAIRRILNAADSRLLMLAPEALAEWRDFQRAVEGMLKPGAKLADFAGWASKLPGQLARVAGLLHLAEHSGGNIIAKPTMTRALDLGALFIEHALAAFAEMGIDADTANARRCWRWIEGRATFTRGELTTAMRHSMNADLIGAALRLLGERSLIDGGTAEPGTKRRTYQINPALHGGA